MILLPLKGFYLFIHLYSPVVAHLMVPHKYHDAHDNLSYIKINSPKSSLFSKYNTWSV